MIPTQDGTIALWLFGVVFPSIWGVILLLAVVCIWRQR
jgi:hypothetical protein